MRIIKGPAVHGNPVLDIRPERNNALIFMHPQKPYLACETGSALFEITPKYLSEVGPPYVGEDKRLLLEKQE